MRTLFGFGVGPLKLLEISMMRPRIALLALNVAVLVIAGCGRTNSSSTIHSEESAFDLAAMRSVIEARNQQFTNAHLVGSLDSAAMVNIFTSDARILPPNADPVIGRPAIEALTALYMTMGITEFREETTAFYGNDEMLVDEGAYVFVYDEGKTERGKYVNIWRKEGGEWKIYSNMWNTNTPPAAAN
jgi:ketosteroid isomerase-like protein